MADQQIGDAPYVVEELRGHVMWLTLNRPQQRNPLSSHMIAALHAALDAVEAASDGPAALLITGTGKAFSVGLNVQTIMAYQPEQMATFNKEIRRLYGRLVNLPLPTIAAIKAPTTSPSSRSKMRAPVALISLIRSS